MSFNPAKFEVLFCNSDENNELIEELARCIDDADHWDIFDITEEITSYKDFYRIMTSGSNMLYALKYAGELVGCIWLNRLMGNSCFVHFCGFETVNSKRYAIDIGRYLSEDWLLKGSFEIIFGCIPSSKKRLNLFLEKIFFKKVCILPKLYYSLNKRKNIDCTLFMKTRKDL